ncbi:MAG: type site-specific deoxyribonuclease [Conexibacter sp.]|nr:type site-specific deoxyribonuclease [Conexibacter sp.]
MTSLDSEDLKPEQRARRQIDALLVKAGWTIQNHKEMNLGASRFVAVREFPTPTGPADYVLYVDGKIIGTLEAKPQGKPLSGVETQADRYADGLARRAAEGLPCWSLPVPFHYMSTGTETMFTSRLDPVVRPRPVFAFHQPEYLRSLLELGSIRQGVRTLPPLHIDRLRPSQIDAIEGLEASLRDDRPRALIEMATGGGKTIMGIAEAYRLLRWGKARRILFLVDRRNLGKQARDAFNNWQTPDDGRKFGELYDVQLLTSNTIRPSASVVITTIQRMYSILSGDESFEGEREDISGWENPDQFDTQMPVVYQPRCPIETFDLIFIDECHRSIYGRWGQVLSYFDAFLAGLTATAAKQTYGFFSNFVIGEGLKPNVVSEYSYDQSVLDGVNVDYRVFRIKTEITDQGGALEAGEWVTVRDRRTRSLDSRELDEDFGYSKEELDRAVVAQDQIRTVIRAFRDKLPEMFPGRAEVPKTVVFCKDDGHAEDVLAVIREEFGRGSEFAKKITYTSGNSDQLIQDFRTDPRFRIAVSVDQISTGTDIKALECLLFMRKVKSRLLFEQMKGRGVRTINSNDLQAVTPDAQAKTHFVLVDAVGITDDEHAWVTAPPLDREPTVALKALLQRVAEGVATDDVLTTIASRLTRLDKRLSDDQRTNLASVMDGMTLINVAKALVAATQPAAHEREVERAAEESGVEVPPVELEEALAQARARLVQDAVAPLLGSDAREAVLGIQTLLEQVIDLQSQDSVTFAGFVDGDRARELVKNWEQFIAEHHDEYVAIAAYYQQPAGQRLSLKNIRELAQAISLPPHNLTPEQLWAAYQALESTKVKGSGPRKLVDLVSLIRFAVHADDELQPYGDLVRLRYSLWLTEQESAGKTFTPEQRRWLDMVAEHVATSMTIEPEDFDLDPFRGEGGIYAAHRAFGDDLRPLLDELNDKLVVS